MLLVAVDCLAGDLETAAVAEQFLSAGETFPFVAEQHLFVVVS